MFGDEPFSVVPQGDVFQIIGAIKVAMSVFFTFRGKATTAPTIIAHIKMGPGKVSEVYAGNDADFFVNNLQRTRDNSAINDAELTGVICFNTPKTITGATNAGPIVITAAGHGLTTGRQVMIINVAGNVAANGLWTITVVDANTFSLNGSNGSGAYASGGKVYPCVVGGTEIDLAYIAGSSGNYVGTILATLELVAGVSYARFVLCSNYAFFAGPTAISVTNRP